MKDAKLISIIVPIYKVELYLRKCIDSILKQTFRDFELILVDDGSPDKCPQICDEYREKDNRIIVIHKKNGGLVSARKAGLKIARGEYILNVDGDDFIDPDMLGYMYNLALTNNADVVVTGYLSHSEEKIVPLKNRICSGVYKENRLSELFESLIYSGNFYESGIIPAVWNKLFKRDLYYDFQMNVPEHIRMGEDFAVSYPVILNSKIVVVDNEFHPYHYRIVANSMSREFNESYFDGIVCLLNYVQKYIPDSLERQFDFYKLFIIKIGCDSVLFKRNNSTYNIFSRNQKLKKIIKNSNIKNFLERFDTMGIQKDLEIFVKAIKRNRYLEYILMHYFQKFKLRVKG